MSEHDEKAFIGRLIEAELLFQTFDEFGIEPLRATVFRVHIHLRAALRRAACAKVAAGGTGNARRRTGIGAGELGDDAFDRSARRELHDDEGHQHDPENRGNHKEDAPENVSGHRAITIFAPADPAAPRPKSKGTSPTSTH